MTQPNPLCEKFLRQLMVTTSRTAEESGSFPDNPAEGVMANICHNTTHPLHNFATDIARTAGFMKLAAEDEHVPHNYEELKAQLATCAAAFSAGINHMLAEQGIDYRITADQVRAAAMDVMRTEDRDVVDRSFRAMLRERELATCGAGKDGGNCPDR